MNLISLSDIFKQILHNHYRNDLSKHCEVDTAYDGNVNKMNSIHLRIVYFMTPNMSDSFVQAK